MENNRPQQRGTGDIIRFHVAGGRTSEVETHLSISRTTNERFLVMGTPKHYNTENLFFVKEHRVRSRAWTHDKLAKISKAET